MLRTILTPLRARFDASPRIPPNVQPPQSDEQAPEDFARDVLIELMRNSVENLKQADGPNTRVEVLVEIQRIMFQDRCTKDVFREMDGFLALISVLSALPERSGEHTPTSSERALHETSESVRLAFTILAEAMDGHQENTRYFQHHVGYDTLAQALRGLSSDLRMTQEVMGFLLSLALNNFSLSGLFTELEGKQNEAVDNIITELEPRLCTIRHPGAVLVLWNFAHQVADTDPSMRLATFKLFERLSHVSHRNQAVLSSLGLLKSVFSRFCEVKQDPAAWEKERHVLQKLLRRLLDVGATTSEARPIFQKVVRDGDELDPEILEVIRSGMKSRWMAHFSLESPASLVVHDANAKKLPATGFSFMTWIWLTNFPSGRTHCIFTIDSPSGPLVKLSIAPDGKLELSTSGNREAIVFSRALIKKSRWTHIALVHYPHRASNPTIRIFIDGALIDGINWSYPKPEPATQNLSYIIGDRHERSKLSWSMSSAHLLAIPIGDDLPRLIHHLGPRYTGNFQDPMLIKFLTYDASTSLNMFLSTMTTKNSAPVELSVLMKAIQHGLGITESQIIFSVTASSAMEASDGSSFSIYGACQEMKMSGDVFLVKGASLDVALWKLGGAAVALRLVRLANSPHELSRALGILVDGVKNSWQNSEDMERLRGYDVLSDILRGKGQIINLTGFETLFEFLGLNFRTPELSTVVNLVAYEAIALDFELWSRTRSEIQRAYLEHFTILIHTSRYNNFNIKQRLSKLGLVRKLLFSLQTDWFQHEMLPHLLDALKAACEAQFSKEEVIKPVVSYLAANLHSDIESTNSPRSTMSRIDWNNKCEKAEKVLEMLVSILSIQTHHSKFMTALPLTRICLLFLGERPTPFVAIQVLQIVRISIAMSPSFVRKFELVSGWSVLKIVLPFCWDAGVHEVAFEIMLGSRSVSVESNNRQQPSTVECPHIIPAILSVLQSRLLDVAKNAQASSSEDYSPDAESTTEKLVEDLMSLHTSNNTFRQAFKSQQTTQLFVDAYKAYVTKISSLVEISLLASRVLDKCTHFGLALALDESVAGSQKREVFSGALASLNSGIDSLWKILDSLRLAEGILNPTAEKTVIDPMLVSDKRTIRQRIASARFSMQVGERTVIKILTRMSEWRKTIRISERKRLRKSFLDLQEYRRQTSRLQDWSLLLTSERGLWPIHEARVWRLDETEGPYRVRKKLEPENTKSPSSRVDGKAQRIRDVHAPEADAQSMVHVEVPPWAESYEISATDIDDRQLAEDIVDDKLRRVRHELEPGDIIEAVATVARVVGVDSSPGLLIIGRTHIYMLDGVVENDDGEVIDAHDAPKRLLFVPGSLVELDGPQRAQRWAHDQVVASTDKKFLFRDVGLELYFKDSRSQLIVFLDKKRRLELEQRLFLIINRNTQDVPMTSGLLRTPVFGRGVTKPLLGLHADELSTATRKWQAREISNFTYLSILNQISGRTPSDATQYPVFPWVLSDYTSQILDLNSPDAYRDLTRPMGALTPARREAALTKYTNLQSVDEEPFHYGTHFSSSMIVCHFLIRLAPFTNMFKTLQGGDWDLPDRLFSDLPRAYESAAHDVRGDVRELIPEFYTCPEFLENSANHDFGVQQHTGERIHDTRLPPWAREDPLLFITMHRRALESPYVSEHLPSWIDLIWGCKQRDPDSLNVFHPLSYEGSIDLDAIKDDLEREATVGIIHNFGQIPRKLFNTPHPERLNHGLYSLPIGTLHGIEEDPHLLVQNARCFKDLGPNHPVRELVPDVVGEKMNPCPEGSLCFPVYPHEQIEWRVGSTELRVVVDHKVVQVTENAFCTCAAFADHASLVTGSSDYTVRLWKITRGQSPAGGSYSPQITLSHIMRIHTDEVTCVTASRTWSLVVSGSQDGSAALWDLNRGAYVRSIWHGELNPVNLVAINESTGYIATCSRLKLCLHTINARPMATLDLTTTSSFSSLVPTVTSMAFHEREYSHLGVLATGGPDGMITLRTWTADGTPEGEKAQWEFVTIRTMKVRIVGRGVHRPPSVTALKFLGETLYHGEETGKSYMWSLPE